MRRVGFVLFVLVLCSPLVFVLYLLTAAQFPKLDGMTTQMPMDVRSAVSEILMKRAGYGEKADAMLARVIVMDPGNVKAWDRRCQFNTRKDPRGIIDICQHAIALDPSAAWSYNALGLAQEKLGDNCTAEDSFTKAIGKQNGQQAEQLRNMGEAAFRCGHEGASVAGFELAEQADAKSAADPDDDDDTRDDLKFDREYLVMLYEKTGDTEREHQMCSKVHPEWSDCTCVLDDKGVKCTGTPVAEVKK